MDGHVFETARLILRPWKHQEAARLFDIRRRDEVAQWLGDPTPWATTETAHENITAWAELMRSDPPCGVWAIAPQDSSDVAGSINLSRLPDSDEVHIGWLLHPDSTGMGYASEGAKAVLERALLMPGVARVWAIMWPSNEASARVAGQIGMRRLGVVDDPWYGTESDPTSLMFRADRPRAD